MTTRIKVLAGTQLIENVWQVLKHHIVPAESGANIALIEEYCLAYMYRSHCTEDPFSDLGRAVRSYMEHFDWNPWTKDPSYQKKTMEDMLEEEARAAELGAAMAPAEGELPLPFAPRTASPAAPAPQPAQAELVENDVVELFGGDFDEEARVQEPSREARGGQEPLPKDMADEELKEFQSAHGLS
jgi:hypothetical protein